MAETIEFTPQDTPVLRMGEMWLTTPDKVREAVDFALNNGRLIDFQQSTEGLNNADLVMTISVRHSSAPPQPVYDLRNGLTSPDAERAAPYLSVDTWVKTRVVVEEGASATAQALYADYRWWMAKWGLGHGVLSARAFGDALRDRCFPLVGKTPDGLKLRGGLRLKDLPAPAPQPPKEGAAPLRAFRRGLANLLNQAADRVRPLPSSARHEHRLAWRR